MLKLAAISQTRSTILIRSSNSRQLSASGLGNILGRPLRLFPLPSGGPVAREYSWGMLKFRLDHSSFSDVSTARDSLRRRYREIM